MKYVILLLFFCSTLQSQDYKLTRGKLVGLTIISIGSFTDGFVEGYEFDGRTYFEKKFGASRTGRFGSLSWERRYTNRNIWNKHMGVFDFYHVADDTRKFCYIGGAITLGISSYRNNKNLKHHFIDGAITVLASSFFKSLGMRIVRQ